MGPWVAVEVMLAGGGVPAGGTRQIRFGIRINSVLGTRDSDSGANGVRHVDGTYQSRDMSWPVLVVEDFPPTSLAQITSGVTSIETLAGHKRYPANILRTVRAEKSR